MIVRAGQAASNGIHCLRNYGSRKLQDVGGVSLVCIRTRGYPSYFELCLQMSARGGSPTQRLLSSEVTIRNVYSMPPVRITPMAFGSARVDRQSQLLCYMSGRHLLQSPAASLSRRGLLT